MCLRINIPKTKAMRINATNTSNFTLQQQHIENVQSFCYLGSIITTNGGSKEDVQNRINKARQAYGQLSHVWNSHHISWRTMLGIFSSCVKSVALYGCGTQHVVISKQCKSLSTVAYAEF
ncbi:hypothetical protein CVS40_8300 [Lucilia cuprina]|nr:hypothetical protein CVS40_8300 [Lucilia cuprina]